ncbi:hypothetical protein BB560_002072 [Smittium megazygosporum]|uniref:PHD-type domain-containing protein n=1 Tax=Smittium megazygosporum TaxID=133381 RepID=A0A2T9Y604_9FUNG|nr:hypothetical protein BB560_006439 [Smittium megazygosporum]PVV03446.1 hypothetical protein BB560_002072 [Smittium megazygosporum]
MTTDNDKIPESSGEIPNSTSTDDCIRKQSNLPSDQKEDDSPSIKNQNILAVEYALEKDGSLKDKHPETLEAGQNDQKEIASRDNNPASDTITASEYLAMQEQLEKEAAQLFPGKFDQCTLNKGYIRQNVYVCLTCCTPKDSDNLSLKYTSTQNADITDDFISCILEEALAKTRTCKFDYAEKPISESSTKQDQLWSTRVCKSNTKKDSRFLPPPNFQVAGICYGCSISCHSNHDVIELFAKRSFACDCGTLAMQRIHPNKCNLKDKYPNISSTTNSKNSYNHNFWGYYCRCDTFYDPNKEPREMIQCFVCNDWYHDSCIGLMPNGDDYDSYICRECVKKCKVVSGIKSARVQRGIVDPNSEKVITIESPKKESNISHSNEYANLEIENLDQKVDEVSTKCRTRFDDLPSSQMDFFADDDWIKDLCTCEKCKKVVSEYESLYEAGIKELSKMDRIKAIEGSEAYKNLYQSIRNFLEPFAASNKPVESKDIKDFFSKLGSKRKRA